MLRRGLLVSACPEQLRTNRLATLVLWTQIAASLAQSPKMKIKLPIPLEITTPDKVQTRIGTLNCEYGMPGRTELPKYRLDKKSRMRLLSGSAPRPPLPNHRGPSCTNGGWARGGFFRQPQRVRDFAIRPIKMSNSTLAAPGQRRYGRNDKAAV